MPALCEHLDTLCFSLDLIAFQWITCLFSMNVPQSVGFVIWDLFFLKGITVIFRFSLTILSLMEPELLKADKFEEVYNIIENFPMEKLDIKTMLVNLASDISKAEVERLRIQERIPIMAMVKS